jgi:hypothetical protein
MLGCCLLVWGCGDQRSEGGADIGEINTYLDRLKPILQELRSLDVEIARAVPADSISSDVIVPLIESRFRPKLLALQAQARQINPTPELATTHKYLEAYLRLRLEAFELAIRGARQGQPELFAQFGLRLAEADEAGRALKTALDQARLRLVALGNI